MGNYFPGATIDDLPEGNGWAIDFAQLCTHSGTHLDAPWHYYPTMNNGEKAWTIDEVPLEWCVGNGVKVDMRDKPDGYRLMPEDFEEYFKKVGYELQPGDILLLNTGADKRWGTKEYLVAGCGVSKAATLWMIDKECMSVVQTDGVGMSRFHMKQKCSRKPEMLPYSGKVIVPVPKKHTAISKN